MQKTLTKPERKHFSFRPKHTPEIAKEITFFNVRYYQDKNGNFHRADEFDREFGRPQNLKED